MALQLINLDLSSAQGIKENNLAPNEGQSASIMALLFIKLDLLSAQGIKENFLAPLDVQRVVGRAQVYRLWRSNSSIWICQVFFILMALLLINLDSFYLFEISKTVFNIFLAQLLRKLS